MPNLVLASCCKVDVINGGDGLFLLLFLLIFLIRHSILLPIVSALHTPFTVLALCCDSLLYKVSK